MQYKISIDRTFSSRRRKRGNDNRAQEIEDRVSKNFGWLKVEIMFTCVLIFCRSTDTWLDVHMKEPNFSLLKLRAGLLCHLPLHVDNNFS